MRETGSERRMQVDGRDRRMQTISLLVVFPPPHDRGLVYLSIESYELDSQRRLTSQSLWPPLKIWDKGIPSLQTFCTNMKLGIRRWKARKGKVSRPVPSANQTQATGESKQRRSPSIHPVLLLPLRHAASESTL